MRRTKPVRPPVAQILQKVMTGIQGLDEITGGGLPQGRPTLISGGAGAGKTMFALEFLVRGATEFGESGVFISFEETIADLTKNASSLGFNLERLVAKKKLFIDHIQISRSEIAETGEYDLDGLFIRIADAVKRVGAKRVVLDTIEALFGELPNPSILRAEIRRLFGWLKDQGLTTVITAERDRPEKLTRHGIEEFVSDCVIVLDHRIREEISTRRLRVVKYRGSTHGTNEYPFLIDEHGISVLPISSLGLDHTAPTSRISTGIDRLDGMMGGKGFFRGSSILMSGTSGTGKTSVAAHFVDAACRSGERCLYFAFEESPRQIIRNMRSIGIDLEPWLRSGLLQFHAARPTYAGIEEVLLVTHKHIDSFKPGVVIVDPITNLLSISSLNEVRSMLTRLVDFLKTKESYMYCGAYGNGTFIVRGFGASEDATKDTVYSISPGRAGANDAIHKAAGTGQPVTQDIAVTVKADSVECSINGTVVGTYPKAEVVTAGRLKSTDGIYGIRFAHNTDATVTGLTLVK